MENEIWLPVKGFESIYEVSNLGRVKSITRHQKYNHPVTKDEFEKVKHGKLLKLNNNGKNYLQVNLAFEGKKITKKVHNIVASAFLNHTTLSRKIVVDHIDNNRMNNRADNLQVITQRHNSTKDKINFKDGLNCVYKRKYGFCVMISIGRERKYFGFFRDVEKAIERRNHVLENLESYL